VIIEDEELSIISWLTVMWPAV